MGLGGAGEGFGLGDGTFVIDGVAGAVVVEGDEEAARGRQKGGEELGPFVRRANRGSGSVWLEASRGCWIGGSSLRRGGRTCGWDRWMRRRDGTMRVLASDDVCIAGALGHHVFEGCAGGVLVAMDAEKAAWRRAVGEVAEVDRRKEAPLVSCAVRRRERRKGRSGGISRLISNLLRASPMRIMGAEVIHNDPRSHEARRRRRHGKGIQSVAGGRGPLQRGGHDCSAWTTACRKCCARRRWR